MTYIIQIASFITALGVIVKAVDKVLDKKITPEIKGLNTK